MDVPPDEVVQAAPQTGDAVRQLVREAPLPRVEAGSLSLEGLVQPPSPLCLLTSPEGRSAPGGRFAQSSIPWVGDEGTAISRDGMRPARKASRPATIACFIA